MASTRTSEPTLSPFLEATTWAAELEEWAFVKERVLERLDIRAAKKARALAHELRDAVVDIEASEEQHDEVAITIALQCIARIRGEAVKLIAAEGDGDQARPPRAGVSGSRQRLDLLARTSVKSTRRSGT